MFTRMTDDTYHTTIVCIDSYTERIPRGRLYNPFWENAVPFDGTMQFLLNMETLLDSIAFPQPFTQPRTFQPRPERSCPPQQCSMEQQGKVGTFALQVLFRQNASWQGAIQWLEGRSEETFRSVLELLHLLDSVLISAVETKT